MTALPNVVEDVSAAWRTEWPETPPIAFLLRSLHPGRWVRFHSLPGSKRHAETDNERAEILSRHHAVLEALGPSTRLFVISTRFASDRSEGVSIPGESLWTTIEANDYFEEPAHLYVSSHAYPSIEFDDVLKGAAEWELANVIVGPHDLRWLYHPYDGGADVIAATSRQRDQLSVDFRTWLSDHSEGL